MLFREISALYPDNHMKPVNIPCVRNSEHFNVKIDRTRKKTILKGLTSHMKYRVTNYIESNEVRNYYVQGIYG
jgi:hypothetical protein